MQHQISSLTRAAAFNAEVGLDGLVTYFFTTYYVAARSKGRRQTTATGPPKVVRIDADWAFCKDFSDAMDPLGVQVKDAVGQAPWRTERHGGWLKLVVARVVEHKSVTGWKACRPGHPICSSSAARSCSCDTKAAPPPWANHQSAQPAGLIITAGSRHSEMLFFCRRSPVSHCSIETKGFPSNGLRKAWLLRSSTKAARAAVPMALLRASLVDLSSRLCSARRFAPSTTSRSLTATTRLTS